MKYTLWSLNIWKLLTLIIDMPRIISKKCLSSTHNNTALNNSVRFCRRYSWQIPNVSIQNDKKYCLPNKYGKTKAWLNSPPPSISFFHRSFLSNSGPILTFYLVLRGFIYLYLVIAGDIVHSLTKPPPAPILQSIFMHNIEREKILPLPPQFYATVVSHYNFEIFNFSVCPPSL